jgi:hypothetical protein
MWIYFCLKIIIKERQEVVSSCFGIWFIGRFIERRVYKVIPSRIGGVWRSDVWCCVHGWQTMAAKGICTAKIL